MQYPAPIVAKLRERADRYGELTALVGSPNVEPRRMPELLRERGALEHASELWERYQALRKRRAEADALAGDSEMADLAREELSAVEQAERELYQEVQEELVSDADLRRRKVIFEIRAGTGGDEAALFAADLFRLYSRLCDQQGWKLELIEASGTELGGYKEVVFGVEGENVWRYLRHESGGHRVQRVPATEAQGRVHTSAATVAVLAEAEEVDLTIRPDDLRIDTMRAGGAGGQHVNKTESAVRITHIPTGVVVVCMDGRSQHKNRETAMRVLRTRLFEAERARLHAERSAQRKSLVGSGDRSERVRTYNFPQNRLSDHRLGENWSLEQVMAGKLMPVLLALDERDRAERIANL
ncbi:MAG: peptide chain release factor 1 [Planctomycetes bacterium]|nr:peptide chain release factor 1 [Planctomycetota bacterium]